VLVRVMPDQLEKLDSWRKRHSERMGRPEAIRRLVEQALSAESPAKPKRGN
jgi:hypothetical protein